MARQNGTWVEYSNRAQADGLGEPRIERTFSSELQALRSAVRDGNATTFVQFGETIAEALERAARKPSAAKPAKDQPVTEGVAG